MVTEDARSELIRLATRLIAEEAMEAEQRDELGHDYDERGAAPGQGYRNGYRRGKLKTAEGLIEYAVPQVAGAVSLADRWAPGGAPGGPGRSGD